VVVSPRAAVAEDETKAVGTVAPAWLASTVASAPGLTGMPRLTKRLRNRSSARATRF
jgi:hypothetical protein